MKFRKKPVVIEAVQFSGEYDDDINEWLIQKASAKCAYIGSTLTILTLEGLMTANPGDWIICGVAGEIYPCKPDIFEQTYERVNE